MAGNVGYSFLLHQHVDVVAISDLQHCTKTHLGLSVDAIISLALQDSQQSCRDAPRCVSFQNLVNSRLYDPLHGLLNDSYHQGVHTHYNDNL